MRPLLIALLCAFNFAQAPSEAGHSARAGVAKKAASDAWNASSEAMYIANDATDYDEIVGAEMSGAVIVAASYVAFTVEAAALGDHYEACCHAVRVFREATQADERSACEAIADFRRCSQLPDEPTDISEEGPLGPLWSDYPEWWPAR